MWCVNHFRDFFKHYMKVFFVFFSIVVVVWISTPSTIAHHIKNHVHINLGDKWFGILNSNMGCFTTKPIQEEEESSSSSSSSCTRKPIIYLWSPWQNSQYLDVLQREELILMLCCKNDNFWHAPKSQIRPKMGLDF